MTRAPASTPDGPPATALLAVRLGTLALPPGPLRQRYRLEFTAELCGIDPARRSRFAMGVLSRSWALRRATSGQGEVMENNTRTKPLLCRLNMHHVWHTASTEDGHRYRCCTRCEKEHPSTGGGNPWVGFW